MQTNSRKAIVWSQENCQYCNMAVGILQAAGYEVQTRKVGNDEGNYTKQDLLNAVPHARSVPQVFINDTYVGGYKEVSQYLKNDNT